MTVTTFQSDTLANPFSAFAALSLLGGKRTVKTQPVSNLEWIDLVRHGVPVKALENVLTALGLGQAELAKALDIPERTLIRRKKEGVLSREESGKLVRLAQVVERAVEVFEDKAAALDWLKHGNPSLGGHSPLSLLDTAIGAVAVTQTLGRIEHGVFA